MPLNIYTCYITTYIHQTLRNCNTYLPFYCRIFASNKYAPQMPQIWNMPKLLDMHLWGSMLIYTTYEVAPINDVARITSHKWQCHQWCRMMVTPQPNYIYWVGCLVKAVENTRTTIQQLYWYRKKKITSGRLSISDKDEHRHRKHNKELLNMS